MAKRNKRKRKRRPEKLVTSPNGSALTSSITTSKQSYKWIRKLIHSLRTVKWKDKLTSAHLMLSVWEKLEAFCKTLGIF